MYQCQSGFLTGFSWAPPAWKLPCPCSGCVRVSWLPPASPAFQVPGVRISVGQEELASLFIYHLGSVFWSSVREILYFLFEQIISKYPCCNLASIWIFPALKTYCQKGWEKLWFLSLENSLPPSVLTYSVTAPGCKQGWTFLPCSTRSPLCWVSALVLDGNFCLLNVCAPL